MDILNMVFTGVFTVEMLLKLIAFKPRVGPIFVRNEPRLVVSTHTEPQNHFTHADTDLQPLKISSIS